MKIKRELVLLVAGAFALFLGGVLLAPAVRVAIWPQGDRGACDWMDLDRSSVRGCRLFTFANASLQVAGLALTVGGAVSTLVGLINYRTR
jgi:UPF0716 family protein affecting phage T7 exclusion